MLKRCDCSSKLIVFINLDDTLIKTASGNKIPTNCCDFVIQKDVLDKIIEVFPNFIALFVVSNQDDITEAADKHDFEIKCGAIRNFLWYYIREHEDDNKEYPINYCNIYYYSRKYRYEEWRKPNTGMLSYAIKENNLGRVLPSQCVMIGNDFANSDKKCAENFGIDYIDVGDLLSMKFD